PIIYGATVLDRLQTGQVVVREVIKTGHSATAGGGLISGLAGVPLGPLAMTIGAVAGAIVGYSAELLHEGDAAKIVRNISRKLDPGRGAVVAEIAEHGSLEFGDNGAHRWRGAFQIECPAQGANL